MNDQGLPASPGDRLLAAGDSDGDSGHDYLESLVNSLGGVVWEFDWSTGAFTFVSDAAESLLGFPKAAWLRPGFWLERLHPEDAKWAADYCVQATRERRDHDFEYRMIRKDGGEVWVRDIISVDPEKGLDGCLRGILVDITAAKHAATRADSIERRFREALEGTGLLIVQLDASGTVEFANESAKRLLGYGEMAGRSFFDFVPPEQRGGVVDAFGDRIVRGGRTGSYELAVRAADGRDRVIRFNSMNLFGPNGEFAGVMGFGEDVTHRAAYERTLALKAEEFDAIFQLSKDRFLRVSAEGVIVGHSAPSEPSADGTQKSLLGRHHREALPEALASVIADGIERSHACGEMVTTEYELDTLGREAFWEARFLPLSGGDTAIVIRDVTTRVAKEEALRESEERHRMLVELAPYAIYVVGLDDTVLYCNDAAVTLFGGHDRDGLVGSSIAHLLPEDFVPHARAEEQRVAAVAASLQPGEDPPVSESMRCTTGTLDGRIIDIERTLAGILFHGTPALLVIARDMTEEIESARAISESRDFLENLLQMLDSGVLVVDGERRIIRRVNRPAERLFGYERNAMLGMSTSRLHPDDESFERFNSGIADSLGAGELYISELVLRRQDGTLFDAEVALRAITGPGGDRIGIVRDITDRKAAEERERAYLNRLSALAAELTDAEDAERRRLAEDLHDRVSQSLAVCMMHLRAAAAESGAGGESEIALARVLLETAIRETRAITTDLFPPVLRELGLAAALRWLAEEVEAAHGLKCEVMIDVDAERLELSDQSQTVLFRGARELLMNVVKHANAERAVISLSVAGERVRLSVDDDGCGFDIDCVTAGGHSGFGLFSIRDRLPHLGGGLEIDSKPCSGTHATIYVPH